MKPADIRFLHQYPWVVVRFRCDLCKRQGQYRLARLAAKFGSEIPMDTLLDHIAFDCPWRPGPKERLPGKYEVKCRAFFPDLVRPPPPDLPPFATPLRVINGGKVDE